MVFDVHVNIGGGGGSSSSSSSSGGDGGSSSSSSSSRTGSSDGSVGIWWVEGVSFWFVILLSYILEAQKIRDNKFLSKWLGPLALELKHEKGQMLYIQYTFFVLL